MINPEGKNTSGGSNTSSGSENIPIANEPTNNTWQMSAALKIPPFWSNRPDLWFLQVETQFRLKGITSSNTKYDYLISSLPPDSMVIVSDFLANPPREGDKFDLIKRLLVARCQDTEERRLDALLNKIELGDLKPSELFRQMETLSGGNSLVNNSLLKKLWLNKLPQVIQPCVIAIENTHTPEEIFTIADRIFDSTDRPKVCAVQNDQQNDLKKLILDLSDRIKNLETRQPRARQRSFSNRSNRSNRSISHRSKSNHRASNANGFCWYHHRFADKAEKCLPGCTYSTSSKQSCSKN